MFFSQIVLRVPDVLARASGRTAVSKSVFLFDATDPSQEPDWLGGLSLEIGQNNNNYNNRDDSDSSTTTTTTQRINLPPTTLSNIPRPRRLAHLYQENIPVLDRQWVCAIVSERADPAAVLYVVLGGVLITVATILLAVWFHTHMIRQAKMNALRTRAEEEKALGAQRQVIKEREMNEFLSHEVRNPLSNAISALSFVTSTVHDENECHVANDKTRETLRQDLNVMSASLQFINEFLRNVLDVHRSANKQMKIEMSPADIRNDILEPVASILFLRGASSAIQVQVECPDDLICQTDRMRLKQIVLNLSSNAVKFVEKGYIRLLAKTVNNSVEISVEDSGPGIPESKRHRLFAKFQQSLDELNQGTGIGLAVCKNLSDLMGANIFLDESFESGVSGCLGTRFVIRLNQPAISVEGENATSNLENHETDSPKAAGDLIESSTTPSKPPVSLPESLSVLFVDDDMVLRRMFTRALERVCATWEITCASNGETALRITETQNFDLIFMDQYMASVEKQMLGTETVRALRSRGEQCVICGLSANNMEQQFIEAGADAFLFKPFPCEKEVLSAEVARVLESRNTVC
mmetsp:Transcript_7920/g.15838  ORF Transcript_7920/g.15838 Transcript_7920/m.15838 type:complete len:580 (+) Transcript_7920:245-1984(+)